MRLTRTSVANWLHALQFSSRRLQFMGNVELWAVSGLAVLIMIPRLQAPFFGLLDDPTLLDVSQRVLGGDPAYPLVLGQGSGRFFPVFWYFLAGQYALWQAQPLGFYIAQCVCLIVTTVAITRLVRILSGSAQAALIAGILFVLSPPIIENYYTLGKTEVQLTLYLSLSILCLATAIKRFSFWRLRFATSILLLFCAYLTKETALVMLPVSLCWVAGYAWIYRGVRAGRGTLQLLGWFSAATLVCVLGIRLIARFAGVAMISSGSYSQNYAFTSHILLPSLFGQLALLARDYSFLFWIFAALVLTALWDGLALKSTRLLGLFGASVIWGGAFLGVLLPWRNSVQEYYLLPASVGLCAACGFGVEMILRVWRGRHRGSRTAAAMSSILLICAVGSVSFLLSAPINMQTNGMIETTVDRQSMMMLDAVARIAPNDGTVLFNLDEYNEYIIQAATYLRAVKQRPDLHVTHISSTALPRLTERTLIVTLHVQDTPTPSVRIAGYGSLLDQWNAELLNALDGIGEPIYASKERIPLTVINTQQWICPALRWVDRHTARYISGDLCKDTAIIRTHTMQYGWSIYKIP